MEEDLAFTQKFLQTPIYQDITVYNFTENTQIHYFYDEEEKENFIPVAIFGGDLKLDLKYIFGS